MWRKRRFPVTDPNLSPEVIKANKDAKVDVYVVTSPAERLDLPILDTLLEAKIEKRRQNPSPEQA